MELTKPRLHSKTACRKDLQASGSSSVCCLRHSDGSLPFFNTQSDRMRQSFNASSRGSQVADIVKKCSSNLVLNVGEYKEIFLFLRQAEETDVRSEVDDLIANKLHPPFRTAIFRFVRRSWDLAFSSSMPKLPPAVASLVRAGPSTARLLNRGLISIVGPQATDWLNGILASTVPNPPTGHFFTAILQAHASTISTDSSLLSPSNLKVFVRVHQG